MAIHPIDPQTLPYRDCVGIAVFNREGQVFLGKRMPRPGAEGAGAWNTPWQMPQGGIDKGETPRGAAVRELAEETGITDAAFLAEAPDWIVYDLPAADLGIAFKGKYRGQRQRWFAFVYQGRDEAIDLSAPADGGAHAEFCDWRWADLREAPDLIVPFKREAYHQVVAAFAHLPARIREMQP